MLFKAPLNGLLSLFSKLTHFEPEQAVALKDFIREVGNDPWCRDEAIHSRFNYTVASSLPSSHTVTLREAKVAVFCAVSDIVREEIREEDRNYKPEKWEMRRTARLIAEKAFSAAANPAPAAAPAPINVQRENNIVYPDFKRP